jgi:glycosyltransferase involved in cell wall biosynthesis
VKEKPRIICFGPGPKFKGGISNYNTSLAKALNKSGAEVHIISWSQQYPAIIPREFVDKSSKKDHLQETEITVEYITNYNKPSTWRKTADKIIQLNPRAVIFQWSIAIQGLPIGKIIKRIKKKSNIEVIADLHFVIQKENSLLDKKFTKLGIQNADTYIVHAIKTFEELKSIFPHKKLNLSYSGERADSNTVIKLFHPIYDLYKPNPDFDAEQFKSNNGLSENVILFFGFIRKYKGLHNLIPAFKIVAENRNDVSLLICGESFWKTMDQRKLTTKIKTSLFKIAKSIFLRKKDDEGDYNPLALIEELELQDRSMVVNEFVPNEDVHKYFQASDAVALFYEYATPSGIESLSYNFKLPLLATNVGHFPETIEDGVNGYLAEANDINSMAAIIEKFLDHPLPASNVQEKTKEMSWENYAKAILQPYL